MLKYFGIFSLLTFCLFVSCAKNTAKEDKYKNNNQKVRSVSSPKSVTYRRATTDQKDLNKIRVDYANQSTDLGVDFDLDRDDINIVLKGNRKRDNISKLKEQQDKKQEERNALTKGENVGKVVQGIRQAQNLFYNKQYEKALKVAKAIVKEKETAEGFALLGSIYYMLGEKESASRNWKQALKVDPDIPGVVEMLELLRIKAGN